MQNNFSKCREWVPRGTSQHKWRWLTTLLLILTLGIGQMWATDYYNLFYGSTKAENGDNVNHEDFVFSRKATIKTGQTSTSIGGDSYTHYLVLNGYGASSLASADTSKVIYYHAKTTSTKLTVYIKNGNSSKKKYYIDHLFEGETAVAGGRKYEKELAKSSESGNSEKKEYTFTNTDGKNVVIGIMPGQNGYVYQVIAEESGTPLKKAGEEGYSLAFPGRYSSLSALYPVIIDEMEISPSSGLKCLNGPLKIKQGTSYVKFALSQKTVVTVAVYNSRKFIFCAAATPTTAEKSDANKIGNGSAGTFRKALSEGTWYLESENTSELQLSSISFSIPTITYNKNDVGAEGTMSSNTWTVVANGFTAPSGKMFKEWNNKADGTGDAISVGAEMLTDTTLYAIWEDAVTKYAVTKGTHANGDFTITPATQAEGEKVTLVATPNFRYLFDAWEVVKTEDGSATGIVVDANGQFDMPAYAVTVNATFAADSRKQILYLTSNTAEATASNDKLYAALNSVVDYNVIVEAPGSQTLTNYDLIVLHESISGTSSDAAVTGCKTATVPVLNTKSYFYGADKDASKRWTWGAPNAGTSVNGATLNSAYCNIASHPLFNDVTVSEGFFAITTDAAEKCMQPVGSFATGYEGYTLATTPNAATPGGTGCAIHEIPAGTTARGATSGKYLMISVSNAKLNALNANGQKLFQNAAAYLIGSTPWTPATAPTSPAITATPSENYTEGNTITLTASATGTSASTTYTWYKGDNWTAASATTPIQAAATDGNVFTKTAAMDDAGTYWCNISNGTGCDVQASVTITVVSASAPTYAITYVSDHGTAPDAANAASVVLAELSADGWAHKGWTANVDVTVDDASVVAGTLIANGKTAILADDVTFTAEWKEIFTLTFDSKEGSAVAGQSIEDGGHPTAVEDPTKDGYIFLGWSETDGGAVVADITALTISANKTLYAKWALNIQLTEIVFSNSFKGWINGSTVTAFYMEGESAPTIESYAGTNLKATDAVAIVGDEVVVTGSDDNEKHYALTLTAVAPLTTTGAKQTFDGSELYVKSAYGWKWHETDASKQKGWAFQKVADDGRVAKGLTREYFFFGPAESATFTWKVAKKNDGDPAVAYVYVDGVLANTVTSKTDPVVVLLKNSNSIVTFESAQTNGDCGLMDVTLAPWVPVTSVALKEGTTPISEKEIWASTSFTLTAEVNPDNASNKTITWTSSNEAIATVADGVVTGVAANASPVTITASTVDGVTATCEVTVTAAPEPCQTPTINMQPASQAYCAGSEPTLSVDASVTDGGTLHYAWFKDDVTTGSDAATCVVTGAGTYKVVVTNQKAGSLDASVTSSNAVITLNVAAAITTQPENKTDIVSGSPVTLSVVATNATSYKWYSCDDAEKTNAAIIAGAEAAEYVYTCTANGYYYCVVGSACGDDITSNVVSVKLEPSNCNLIASIPDEAPYQYVQAGEWTLYGIDSNGKLATSNKFKNNAKDFGDVTVNAIEDQRIGMIFDKDIVSLTIYATSTSTGRTWKSDQQIRVTSDDITGGSPSYSNVTATRTAATMPTNNKQYIFTADDMLIEAGKKVWLPFSGSVTIFKICYTAAPEKCEAPVLPALASKELCEGDAFTAWDATTTVSDEGTLSYQWYNADTDEALSGEDDAEFTPSVDGNYYVIVTNKKTGYRDNTTKSALVTVTTYAGTVITEPLVDLRGAKDAELALKVEATGKNLHYAWKESATIDGTYTDVAGATDNKTLNVTVTEGMDKYYKVVVSSDCGSDLESVAHVTQFVPVSQQDVTASIVWDWSEAASGNTDEMKSNTTPKRDTEFIMANGDARIYNNANFCSDKLVISGQYAVRGGNYFQGGLVKFHTTVPGVVRVEFSHTATATAEKPARELFINGVGTGTIAASASHVRTAFIEVPAGDVSITAQYIDPTKPGNQYVRVYKVEFYTIAEQRTTGYAAGDLGTVCLEDATIIDGANLYKLAGLDQYGYLAFDEIQSGELEAGVPYLFEVTNPSMIGFYKQVNAAHSDDEIAHKGMIGTFSGTTLNQNVAENYYYFSGRHIWRVNDFTVGITIPAHRCYVDYDAVQAAGPAQAPAAGCRRVTLGVNGKNNATDVENLNASEAPVKLIIDGKMYILRGEKLFDATGRLVK